MESSVSVIIPVLDRQDLVQRTLESVINQTYLPYEIIIVDNGSTDNTIKVVKDWIACQVNRDIRVTLTKERKRGAWAARQKGLNMATGDFILFLDSDDIIYPHLLENVGKTLSEKPYTQIIYWRCKINLLNGKMRIPSVLPFSPLEGHLIHSSLHPGGFLVKKSLIERAGGWNKTLEVWDDLELGFRLLKHNPVIIFINEVLSEMFSQKESITGESFTSKEGEWERSLKEILAEAETMDYETQKFINKIIAYRRVNLAAQYYKEGNEFGANSLKDAALQDLSLKAKLLLTFSYHYTKFGGRGAWRIIRKFY